MHTDQEVLAALRAHFDQDQLSAVLSRVLRVPEAWAALHNPEFLGEIVAVNLPADLTPSHLSSVALGGSLHSKLSLELVETHSGRARQIWDEAAVGIAVQHDLADTALLGIEFGRRFDAGSEGLIERVSDSPSTWRSPIAIAWLSTANPESLLTVLFDQYLFQLAIQVALANFPVREAATYLARTANGSTARMLQEITRSGELQLARSLSTTADGGKDNLSQLLIEAVSQRFNGEHREARSVLDRAWETASQTAARVADFTADQAKATGDAVTELEANRRALEILPTPVRRARTALSLIELNRPGEALALVSGSETSVEELIAGGLAQSQASDTGALLISALGAVDEGLGEQWFVLLTEGLIGANLWAPAVEAAQLWVVQFPSSAKAHVSLARVLHEAGDAEAAVEHAAISAALAPHSKPAYKLQAEIEQELGHYGKALTLWRQLPEADAVDLAESAIAAGDLEFAASTLKDMPASPRKVVLEGMIRKSSGDRTGAIDKLREATRKSPDEIEAYEALAAAQAEGDDSEQVYATLTEAVQANPKEPYARLMVARYLRAQGKASEALELAALAWELDEKNIPAGLEYAELLGELGHTDRALEILRKAAVRQPLSWRVGLALARTYEKRGDLTQAAQAVRPLPTSAPAEAYFHFARIALKAGTETNSALHYLAVAEERGWAEPSLDYWFGIALEREQRFEEALTRYERAQASDDYETKGEAILGSARAALGLDQTSRALAILEEAQAQFPRSARILAAMSDVYLFAKLPEKAQEAAELAIELDPEETHAWHVLGDALASSGDFRGAVSAIERLSALDPEATEGWITLAGLASKANDRKVVRRSIAEALWRGRRNPRALQDTAHFLERNGDLRSAVGAMKAAVRARPDDPQLLSALAKVQEAAGDDQGAFESWQSCLALAPNEPKSLRRSAICAQRLKLGSQSIKLLEKAVAIEPGNPWLRRDLAKSHLEQGQVRQGIVAYARAVKSAPNDSSLAFEAAEIALCAGDPRYALALLSKMDSVLADDGRAQAAMGEAFLLLDKREQAISALTGALEQEYETVRTFSMLAVIAADRDQAVKHLEHARAMSIESAHDAIWLSRAEIALLNGAEAIDALNGWEADAFAAQEQVQVALRARDMYWLFGLTDTVSLLKEDALTDLARGAQEDLHERNLATHASDAWLRVEEAPSELSEYLDLDPLGWIGEAIAISHLRNDQLLAAREALDQVRLVRTTSEWRPILDGMIHEANGHSEDARAAYRSGSTLTPIASYMLGRAYEKSGSLERAATHIGTAVVEAPDQHRWQHKLGSIYRAMEDDDSALAHYQEAVAGDPENQEYLLSLASAYATSGHLNQALEGYTAALVYGSESTDAYRAAGTVALRLGAWQQASTWFERAITLSPSDIDSLVGSAKASMARGDKHLANERLSAAIQQAPDDARVLLGVGHVRAYSGDFKAALNAFEQALEAGADPNEVRRGESKVLIRQGKHSKAAKAMEEVLSSVPDDHRLWHELAETLEAGADLNGAERAISEAIRISPANPEYRLSLARISRKSGNLDRAIEELRQAENADPDDPRVPIEAGLVYEDRRDFTRALDSYLKAVEIDPDSLQANYRAGLLLRTLKAYRKAGEMLKRAAELAPTNQEVMHQLAAVRALELVHG